nr:centromere protein Q isoform X2 [Equus asinus]
MPGKANASPKKSQQLQRNLKRKTDDEEVEFSEKEVRNTVKKGKNHPKRLSSEVMGQTKHTNLKQVKISSDKRKTWQPLSKSSREHLQTMMESVIIAILSNNVIENEQVQYHLNFLKKRLLQVFETLKVPPKKPKDLTNVSSLLKTERAQHRANEEGLALLQEEIDKIVETIESMTGDIESLKNKIQILTSGVEDEEEKVKQLAFSTLDVSNREQWGTVSSRTFSEESQSTHTSERNFDSNSKPEGSSAGLGCSP